FLAEGKGALPAENNNEARERILEMAKFKEAGEVFLVEEWLTGDEEKGEEFSSFAFCDGKNFQMIGNAQDHKRANNFDEGENTGGMGCSSPPLVLTKEIEKEIKEKIFSKVLKGLASEGRAYQGVLYLGGMIIKKKGKLCPYIIEFNARWGDPEAQVLLPGLKNDLYEVGVALSQGKIHQLKINHDHKARVVVAAASKGYPGDYSQVKGKEVFGLEEVSKIAGVRLYGAGVKKEGCHFYANGGRLFYLVGEGKNVIEARSKVYEAMAKVYIEGNNLHYRTDIGWRDVGRLRNNLRE
ncbi:MAG: phosphoribosylamine--glycine ligase, partial [Patescibacteria group bacterium]|nr:phosphoribosylamine--glycine ligase [Patescibacteria group bacterium]